MADVARFDDKIQAGATWTLDVALTDSAGSPISLVGATVHCELREEPSSPVLETATCTVTSGAGGTFTVVLSAAETAALTFSRCRYDVLVIYSGGTRERVLQGNITVEPRVTVVA